jgi:hypothetical protein
LIYALPISSDLIAIVIAIESAYGDTPEEALQEVLKAKKSMVRSC